MAFRTYVTDALMILTENTAKFAGGKTLQVSYYDLISKRYKKVDNRTGNEIAADVIARAGLTLG